MTASAAAPGSAKRQALLERIVDYVLRHGIADLTLRRLADAVGSNNRMLLYYFGSRDELIVTALVAAQERFPSMQSLVDVLDDPVAPLDKRLELAWSAISSPESLPYHRLFFQVFGLAGFERDSFTPLLTAVGTEWAEHATVAFQRAGVNRQQAVEFAHEVIALWRGLQVTLISTGEHALVDRVAASSMAALLDRLNATVPSSRATRNKPR